VPIVVYCCQDCQSARESSVSGFCNVQQKRVVHALSQLHKYTQLKLASNLPPRTAVFSHSTASASSLIVAIKFPTIKQCSVVQITRDESDRPTIVSGTGGVRNDGSSNLTCWKNTVEFVRDRMCWSKLTLLNRSSSQNITMGYWNWSLKNLHSNTIQQHY